MNLETNEVSIQKPLKIYNTIESTGNASFPNIYTIDDITGLLAGLGNGNVDLSNYNTKTEVNNELITKRDISDSYSQTDVNNIFNTNKHITYTSVLSFQDVDSLGVNTLSIIGDTNIGFWDKNNVGLMHMSASEIIIDKPLKCEQTITAIGNCSFPSVMIKQKSIGI